jgi:hypothetical protein
MGEAADVMHRKIGAFNAHDARETPAVFNSNRGKRLPETDPWPVPTLHGQLSCTAAQYSNAADQHRPRTSANGRRPAKITTIDRPARSSGRRGRGFKSRHPDSKTPGQRLCATESRWTRVTNCVTIGFFQVVHTCC